ncbi:MAG TPA: hypothetical protein VIN61_07225 [Gammaproteobacteria bacterium]
MTAVPGQAVHYDGAATWLRAGSIVAAAGEERLSRTKRDARLPRAAIRDCLEEA